ncbi:hypothetical protein K4K61_001767 [Colletotrichum sp. SAR11_59]|uniref:Uncharacterized protein n=1 Tax=Colletotrichum asianum TaxID=702518 RepID=A0A8H3VVS2_9PEZI|nr:hypothetical protein GQ607_015338 [Colletotrichum asianum]KAI8315425.1 hypothetical protein K4K61_001767 [Colletotrichum sp. SAR11_59]KAI8316928.1 hypothetical protein K4K59_012430 [Colletotrichum sp. SAR11_240]
MSKKARPGQGARRRAKKRAEAAKANPDAIDSAKASTLTRRQRITNANERRRMTNARLDQIEQTVQQTHREAAESKKETDSWRFRTDLDAVDFKLSASNVVAKLAKLEAEKEDTKKQLGDMAATIARMEEELKKKEKE